MHVGCLWPGCSAGFTTVAFITFVICTQPMRSRELTQAYNNVGNNPYANRDIKALLSARRHRCHMLSRVCTLWALFNHMFVNDAQRRLSNELWTNRRARRTDLPIGPAVNCCTGVRAGVMARFTDSDDRWSHSRIRPVCTCCTAVDCCANTEQLLFSSITK